MQRDFKILFLFGVFFIAGTISVPPNELAGQICLVMAMLSLLVWFYLTGTATSQNSQIGRDTQKRMD